MEQDPLVVLLLAHKWLAASAFVIGGVIRLAKAGKLGGWFASIPPKLRPCVAVALGGLSAMAESLVAGAPPETALAHGIGAAALAVLGHDVLVEGFRDGREIGVKK